MYIVGCFKKFFFGKYSSIVANSLHFVLVKMYVKYFDIYIIILISENGSVGLLWRRHLQLTYKQVTAMHQSLSLSVFGGTLNLAQSLSQSLSSSTASKDDRKSQG